MIVNRRQFSEFTGKSDREVSRMIDAGMPCTKSGKKGIPIAIRSEEAVRWLVDTAVSLELGKTDSTGSDVPMSARAELIHQRARHFQLRNDEIEGHLVNLGDVEKVFFAAVSLLAQNLDGCAGRMAKGDSVLRERLFQAHRDIRREFADGLAGFGREIEANHEAAEKSSD